MFFRLPTKYVSSASAKLPMGCQAPEWPLSSTLTFSLRRQALVVLAQDGEHLGTAEGIRHLVALGEHLAQLRPREQQAVFAGRAGHVRIDAICAHRAHQKVQSILIGLVSSAPASTSSKMWCASNGP